METTIRHTPLHGWHLSAGANMADFGGYDMPLWYRSARSEHLAVLTHAGLFDTSHMAVVKVTGDGARNLLNWCFTNDLDACMGRRVKPLENGRAVYGAFLNPDGEVLDDAIVFQVKPDIYMVVVNAGMGADIAAHLKAKIAFTDVAVTDLTGRLGKIDIQGPNAGKVMAKVLEAPEASFTKLPYFAFKGGCRDLWPEGGAPVSFKNGAPILLSRTGYTGEFGFELFMDTADTVKVWGLLMDAGKPLGLTPCGLAARDSLRGGAVLPLSHQDIGRWPFINHPWEFALPFTPDNGEFTKIFMGSDALMKVCSSADHTYPFVGKDLRKVSLPAEVQDENGETIGEVLTCVTDMGIGLVDRRIVSIGSPDRPAGFKPRGLCCGFVKVQKTLHPDDLVVLKDQRRKIEVTITDDIRPDRTARKPIKAMLA